MCLKLLASLTLALAFAGAACEAAAAKPDPLIAVCFGKSDAKNPVGPPDGFEVWEGITPEPASGQRPSTPRREAIVKRSFNSSIGSITATLDSTNLVDDAKETKEQANDSACLMINSSPDQIAQRSPPSGIPQNVINSISDPRVIHQAYILSEELSAYADMVAGVNTHLAEKASLRMRGELAALQDQLVRARAAGRSPDDVASLERLIANVQRETATAPGNE